MKCVYVLNMIKTIHPKYTPIKWPVNNIQTVFKGCVILNKAISSWFCLCENLHQPFNYYVTIGNIIL